MKTFMLALAGLAFSALAQAQDSSQTQQAEQMNKLWTHVLSTVQPECAQAVQNQMMAQQEGKQPLPLAEDCEQAVRTEYMSYAQANNIQLTPPPGSEGGASAEAEAAAPAGDSFSTFIVFIVIVLGTLAAAVFYALAQARKREAQLPAGARQQKLKAQAKKQKKGKLQD